MTRLLLAFQFLSIFPIRISGTVRDDDLVRSMRYYPLIGAVLGGLSAVLFWAGLKLFTPMVATVCGMTGLILFSGALHLDGFADMCDGFYGNRSREKILAIMKDSHSGAMAIVGVFGLLAMKGALLSGLDSARAIPALVLLPTLGRWSMVWLCARSTYARSEGGTAFPYIGQVDPWTLRMATFLCAGIAFALFRWKGLLVMAVVALFTWVFRRYTERCIGGMTGDTLGACSELVEVLSLAVLSIRWIGQGL
ncbi:MAG: adenosylcobinamide-GDP ribazoletransferase [Elusimicrobiota bacterium]|jgi:adenosylcobinamide-GDP ribazoletransferase